MKRSKNLPPKVQKPQSSQQPAAHGPPSEESGLVAHNHQIFETQVQVLQYLHVAHMAKTGKLMSYAAFLREVIYPTAIDALLNPKG